MLPTKIQCKITCFLPFCFATTKTVGDTGVTSKIWLIYNLSKSFFKNLKSHNVLKYTAPANSVEEDFIEFD